MNWKKYTGPAIKILIVAFSFWYIIHKLLNYNWSDQSFAGLSDGGVLNYLILFIVFILMLLNWGTESLKWRFLIKSQRKVNFWSAFKAVTGGITFSLITPNRIGEPIGRILFLDKESRAKAAVSTIVGSLSQLTVTIVPGAISATILILYDTEILHLTSVTNYIIATVLILLTVITLFCYFNIRFLEYILIRLFRLKKWSEYIMVFSQYSKKELLFVLLMSAFRYLVFVTQFYLLFEFFNVGLSFQLSVLIISATYFVATLIPSITLFEFGIRGSVIIFFSQFFTDNYTSAFAASVLLWFVNIAVPAIIGGVFLLKQKQR